MAAAEFFYGYGISTQYGYPLTAGAAKVVMTVNSSALHHLADPIITHKNSASSLRANAMVFLASVICAIVVFML
jgi:hypothetical protein